MLQGAGAKVAAVPPIEVRAYGKVFWAAHPVPDAVLRRAYLDRVNVGFAKLQMAQDIGLKRHRLRPGCRHLLPGLFRSRCRAT
ncbi:MAG: hypothetical protein U1E17_04385 [Geminicoccaceae bacterium]